MGWIIWTILLLILIGICIPFYSWTRKRSQDQEQRPQFRAGNRQASTILKWVMISLAAIIVLETFIFSFTTVSTKNVGIVTTFGATTGHLSNGAHMIAPWSKVTEMDAAIQTDSYTDADHNCLKVRIGNQQTACVSVSIRWRIDPNMADHLYQNYRTFDHVRDSLVTRDLTAAVNQQFKDYNPLNSVASTAPSGSKPNPSLNAIAFKVSRQMRAEIRSQGIEVLNTIIPIVTFDPSTQNRINQLQQQFALTRIAEQEKITNEAQAQANSKLSRSVNNSPNVLVAQCMQILGEMVKEKQTVPPGFSCWPGKGVAGVIANTGGK